jgi:hypothetical protein
MARIVPSQIVDYLDTRFRQAARQAEGDNPRQLTVSDAPAVACVVEMVDSIPAHLVTLQGDDYAVFAESVAALRLGVARWSGGDNIYQVERIPGRQRLNPMTLLRRQLLTLHDEGAEAATDDLVFVADAELRESLRRDLGSVARSAANGEWKAATVLAGSVVEALLLFVLEGRDEAVNGAVDRLVEGGSFDHRPPGNRETWHLFQLIDVAAELALIEPATANQCRIAKDFRNLIHPGRATRLDQECDRATALSSSAAVEHVIRDLTRG